MKLAEGQSDTRFATCFQFVQGTHYFTVDSIAINLQNMRVDTIVLGACSLF